MRFGLDYLGGAKFPVEIQNNHPLGWAAGFFLKEFGDARIPARLLLEANLVPVVRYQLLYKQSHNFSLADIPAITACSESLVEQVTNHPGVEFRISPCCEHRCDAQTIQKLIDAAMHPFSGLQNVTPVNSPDVTGAVLTNVVNEFHCGGEPRMPQFPYQFSYDGCSCFDANVKKDIISFNSAEVFFFWFPQMNGRKTTNDTTPIPNRKAWPVPPLFKASQYLSNPKGQTQLPVNFTWKSVDEQSNVPPVGRELKPVLICPPNAPHAEIKDSQGNSLDVSDAPLPFSDGRFRYYFHDFGFHFGNIAQDRTGSQLCSVWVGGVNYGTVNPGFRENAYRNI